MSRRLWLVLAFVCALFAFPVSAHAETATGFVGGLQDFMGVREVETVQPEKEFQERYEPETVTLQSEPVRVVNTPLDGVQSVVDSANTIRWGTAGKRKLVSALEYFLGSRNVGQAAEMRSMLIIFPIGLCFMWWGVRKALRMFMKAFRKGSASV